jgi:hypothetical protein
LYSVLPFDELQHVARINGRDNTVSWAAVLKYEYIIGAASEPPEWEAAAKRIEAVVNKTNNRDLWKKTRPDFYEGVIFDAIRGYLYVQPCLYGLYGSIVADWSWLDAGMARSRWMLGAISVCLRRCQTFAPMPTFISFSPSPRHS